MPHRLVPTLVVLAALAAPALADIGADTDTGAAPGAAAAGDEAAIRQRLADWTAAFNARDADAACDLFAPELAYDLPGLRDGTHATMCGNLAKVLARDDLSLRYEPPQIHQVLLSGDLGVVRLTWTLVTTSADGVETSSDEGIDVFRRQPDGRWSIVRYLAFETTPSRALSP